MESAVGKGSQFFFTARFRIPEAKALRSSANHNGVGQRAPLEFMAERKPKILLAEDNAINQAIAARMLERQGCSVAIANNGREAVTAVKNSAFDLVLMDIQMPEMDGLEATIKIRENEVASHRRIPIIAMTAHAMKGDEEMCVAAGMDGYLTKPVQSKKLFEVIYRALSAAPAAVTQEVHCDE